jgi:hypothetical protein
MLCCSFYTASAVPREGMCVKEGEDVLAYEDDLRLCVLYGYSSSSINHRCSGISTARGIKRRTH